MDTADMKYPITLIELSQILSQFGTNTKYIEYNGHLIYRLRENFYGIFNSSFTDVWTFNSQTADYRHMVENNHPVFEEVI